MTQSSAEYHDRARKIKEAVSDKQDLPAPMLDVMNKTVRKSKVLGEIESETGMRFDVMVSGPKHVGGFAIPSQGKVAINEAVLDEGKEKLALQIAAHEKNHIKTGITKLDVEQSLGNDIPEYLRVLKKVLGKSDIGERFLMEGFNELLTERDYGFNEHCKYNEDEVPAARKLERLSLFDCGFSLLSAFEAGNKDLFFKRLKVLCEMLLIKEKVGQVLEN